jgi:hypothetical protein
MLHIPLIHGLMVLADHIRYGSSPYAAEAPWTIGSKKLPEDYGYGLPVVYLVWIAVPRVPLVRRSETAKP